MIWTGYVIFMGKKRSSHKVFVGKHEGKRSPGRPMRRWGDSSPCAFLTEHHAIRRIGGVEVYIHSFFNLGTRWR
jgi:hypothetical protein